MSAAGQGDDTGREHLSPEDREAFRKRSDDLGRRLGDVKGQRPAERSAPDERGAAYGQAFRITAELIAGLIVGGGIGWFLDQSFGTKPVLLIVFIMLGLAAGLLNVVRSAQKMQAKAEPLQRAAPSVADDEDDDDR